MDPLYFMRDQSLTLNADLDFRCKINPCNIEFIENMAIAYLPPFDSSLLVCKTISSFFFFIISLF